MTKHSLDRLRQHFAPKMQNTPDGAVFAVLSQEIDMHGLAFRDAAAKIASVDTLQSFMKDFGKRQVAELIPPASHAGKPLRTFPPGLRRAGEKTSTASSEFERASALADLFPARLADQPMAHAGHDFELGAILVERGGTLDRARAD